MVVLLLFVFGNVSLVAPDGIEGAGVVVVARGGDAPPSPPAGVAYPNCNTRETFMYPGTLLVVVVVSVVVETETSVDTNSSTVLCSCIPDGLAVMELTKGATRATVIPPP